MQFLGDSPEHGWVRETRVFPYTSPGDYNNIIDDLTVKSKKTNMKVPRVEIPSRLSFVNALLCCFFLFFCKLSVLLQLFYFGVKLQFTRGFFMQIH